MTKTVLKDAASSGIATPADISSREFVRRAHERLNFNVPPGLTDAAVLAPTGDFGTDAMLEIIAKERPVRPAAVLVPIAPLSLSKHFLRRLLRGVFVVGAGLVVRVAFCALHLRLMGFLFGLLV